MNLLGINVFYSGIAKGDLERRGDEIAIFSYQRGEQIVFYSNMSGRVRRCLQGTG